jgi:hypothetical protein
MKLKILVAYSLSGTFVQTTLDYLLSFKKYNDYDVSYINVTHIKNMDINFDEYDVVINNYCARMIFEGYLSDIYLKKLREFKGVRILAIQDEYDFTNKARAAISNYKFDIVLTCVPQSSLDYVYPVKNYQNTEFLTVFTGYVSEDFGDLNQKPKKLSDRSIFIGYRGRDIGGRYGRLGFDKHEIGRRMKDICTQRGIQTDIAMDEESRIYGSNWLDFIGNCRAMLGSESGSNIFDFDGSIAALYVKMTGDNAGQRPSYAEFAPHVLERESEIEMGQISPRVFECALLRTPMVLFRGRYSDAILPDEHYISLEKDFSNIDDVLNRLNNIPALEQMTDRAYQHLVASGKFSYRTFHENLRQVIEKHVSRKQVTRSSSHQSYQLNQSNWMDLFFVDRARAVPGQGSEFQARINAHTAKLLADEVDRLKIFFDDHADKCLAIIKQSEISFAQMQMSFMSEEQIEKFKKQNMPHHEIMIAIDKYVSTFAKETARHNKDRDYMMNKLKKAVVAYKADDIKGFAVSWNELETARYANFTPIIAGFNELYDAAQQRLAEATKPHPFDASAKSLLSSADARKRLFWGSLVVVKLKVRVFLQSVVRKCVRAFYVLLQGVMGKQLERAAKWYVEAFPGMRPRLLQIREWLRRQRFKR